MTSTSTHQNTRPTPVAHDTRSVTGLLVALASAAAFGTSGPFTKALLDAGWSAGAIVALRVSGAGLLLLGPALAALRGRWTLLVEHRVPIVLFGLAAVAGCQVAYANAVTYLPVGVALLLEYMAVVLVALWAWARTRIAPSGLTWLGMIAALAGLALVLDLSGPGAAAVAGIAWGLLAAAGLAVYFVAASGTPGLPPVVLACAGMLVGGLGLALLGTAGLLPMVVTAAPVLVAGVALPAWLAVTELAVVAAALAYLLGTVAARRLGPVLASFVGLTEVLFAVLFAWLLLHELPSPVQFAGGALIIAGVVAVRRG